MQENLDSTSSDFIFSHEKLLINRRADLEEISASEATKILSSRCLDNNEMAISIISRAQARKRELFAGSVFPIVPLYVTSYCAEQCLYCNYRTGNRLNVERIRLSHSELLRELEYLTLEKGLRTIELVYASDPILTIDSVCRDITFVKEHLLSIGGGQVGINCEPFDLQDYSLMKSAGVDFIVLWQETYDRDVYEKMHPGRNKKAHYEYRLEAPERMISAGIDRIGMGVLTGLADWRNDWSALFHHQEYMKYHYSIKPPIIGVPRLKYAKGAILHDSPFLPSDDEFLLCIATQALFNPLSLPFINTRENWEFCCNASMGGGVLFTFNCSTIPGGYSLGHAGYQFPTFSFDLGKFGGEAQTNGLNIVNSWTFNNVETPMSNK